jgi:quinol monooxygenase YgiN
MRTPAREIAIIIEYQVSPENRATFMDQLHRNCADTLQDDGCLRMEISQPVEGDGTTFFLTERWRDQASIDLHRQKPGHDDQHRAIDNLAAAKRVAKCLVLSG